MILIDVTLTAKAGKTAAFKQLLVESMQASQSERGCIEYRFTRDLNDESQFYLIELWQDEEALKNHLKGAGFANFIARLPELGEVNSSVAQQGNFSPYQVPR